MIIISVLRKYEVGIIRKRNNSKSAIGIIIIVMVIISILAVVMNNKVMPVIRSLSRSEAKMVAIKSINKAVEKSIKDNKITTKDLLFYDYNEQGEIVSWNVNSIMINKLCTQVADNIINTLSESESAEIKVPLGITTGSHMFSNMGPKIDIDILPKGSANVDYKNQLRAAGINQVNHLVWLEVELHMQIIAPFSSEEMLVQRRIVLVDKVISGKVPTHYLNLPFSN